ncbi:MAG: ribosome small subunit-dependent GTPase A [Thermoguttaceae bacterium]
MAKSQKIRVDFRKNRTQRTRDADLTRQFEEHGFEEENDVSTERVSGKGETSRRRTVIGQKIIGNTADNYGFNIIPEVDFETVRPGRVLRVHGQSSLVQAENGQLFQCVTRRIIKTLATDQRQPVVAGDRVLFRVERKRSSTENDKSITEVGEGMIERIEPRYGTIARQSRNRKHIIVANIDQVLIISSAEQPSFKPNLIDRMLISAESAGVHPVIVINKIDLIDRTILQPIIGVYAQMGYPVLQVSAKTGIGMDALRKILSGKASVFAGQSGVGKSSILNVIDPSLSLRVAEIGVSQKGRHTTTTAELIHLSCGGHVVDTPGLRQFILWDVIPEEVFGFFRDLRPYQNNCSFSNCTHRHEDECAVQNAVSEGRLDLRRYESYLAIRFG